MKTFFNEDFCVSTRMQRAQNPSVLNIHEGLSTAADAVITQEDH